MLVAFDILLAASSVIAAAIQWRRWWHQTYTAELCAHNAAFPLLRQTATKEFYLLAMRSVVALAPLHSLLKNASDERG